MTRTSSDTLLKSRFNAIRKNWIDPCLKELGFKKVGSHYLKQENEFTWVIFVDISQWNTPLEYAFDLTWRIYLPGLLKLYGRPEPDSTKIKSGETSNIAGNLSDLTVPKSSSWHKLTLGEPEEADIKIGLHIQDIILNGLVPFMCAINTKEKLLELMLKIANNDPSYKQELLTSDSNAREYAGIIFFLLGKKKEGLAELDKLYKILHNIPGAQKRVGELREKISKS